MAEYIEREAAIAAVVRAVDKGLATTSDDLAEILADLPSAKVGPIHVRRRLESGLPVLLAKRRLKLSTVSRDTHISRTTLTNIYYGRGSKISFKTLEILCNYLGCAINELLVLADEGMTKVVSESDTGGGDGDGT